MSIAAETRDDVERNLAELCAVRDVLLPDADDAGVQSELTVVESEIRQAEETLLELGDVEEPQ